MGARFFAKARPLSSRAPALLSTLLLAWPVACEGPSCQGCGQATEATEATTAAAAAAAPQGLSENRDAGPAAAEREAKAEPGPGPSAPATPAPAGHKPKPGFAYVSMDDRARLCAFAGQAELAKAAFTEGFEPQTLSAGKPVVIGAFAPFCVTEACDEGASIECRAELQGDTIRVHSRYWGDHKPGVTCKPPCQAVFAGCPTPPLGPGAYTIQHGDKQFPLRIPATLATPCFEPVHKATATSDDRGN